MENACWCGRRRADHRKSVWDHGVWGEWHDFSNQRATDAILPMLAKNSEPFLEDGWIYERKYDGMRAIFTIHEDSTLITSRTGLPLNQTFPELTNLHEKVSPGILDGEIIVNEGTKKEVKENLERLQLRMGLQAPDPQILEDHPVTAVFFDCLQLETVPELIQDMKEWWYIDRRAVLEAEYGTDLILSQIVRHMEIPDGWEGIVAKEQYSYYIPGKRRATWKKWKREETIDAIVSGITSPEGQRKYFGALRIAAYDSDGHLQDIGLVGSGFSDEALEDAWERLKDDGWVGTDKHPCVIVEVEFLGWTKTGKLREPRFKRFRDDKHIRDCILPENYEITSV